jgi:hypothetical protein
VNTAPLAGGPAPAFALEPHRADGNPILSSDASGYSCPVTGVLWGPAGRVFDGVDDAIDIGSRISQAAWPLPLTILAWVNKQPGGGAGGAGSDGIVTLERTSKYVGGWLALDALSGAAYQFAVNYGDNTGASASNRRSKYSWDYLVPEGSWCFIGGALRGPTDMSLFFDGREADGYYSGTGGPMVWTGATGKIGAAVANRSYYFKGTIGEVLVYNRALSELEVQRIYLASRWRYQ